MINKKISVIVPVYNVEKYLTKCLESLISQTYDNFEVLLIDDGSTDSCPLICDYYANKYKFVRTFHKMNGGLSDARNFGISNAEGEYVTFVDSDDYVSYDYLEVLIDLIVKYDAEISVGGICKVFDNKPIKIKKNEKDYLFNSIEALEHMLYQNMIDTSACAMLIPKEIAMNHLFPINKYHEDEFTTYKYYSNVNRVATTKKKIYFYLQREGSIMHVFGKASLDELDAADNLQNFCEEKYKDLVNAAKSKKFSDYCQVLLSIDDLRNPVNIDTVKRINKFLISNKKSILFDSKTRIKNKLAAMLLFFGPDLLVKVNRYLK